MSLPLFDCHCDTIVRARKAGARLRENPLHLDLERLARFSPSAQVFAVCAADAPAPREFCDQAISFFKTQAEENSDILRLCLSSADIKAAAAEGKTAALLSVEGAEQLEDIDTAYSDGVRIVHLTWNYDNELCGAAMDGGGGLSAKGREFTERAQKLGMMLDMSHISERGFFDVVGMSTKPVIAGHSNSKSVCDVPRNLSDGQFAELIRLGGGAGINLCPDFLGRGRDIDAVFAHIEHFMALGGERSVFLGCDLDGIGELPRGISGVQDMGRIYEALLRRNYPEQLVRDIFRNNILDILEKVL